MRKAALARRTLYVGESLALGTAGLLAVMVAEAKLAERAVHRVQLLHAPNPSGWYGAQNSGESITLALLGDSSAAGYGMERLEDTPGAVLATRLADRSGRPVRLHDLSVVGAKSEDLGPQVDKTLAAGADAAVILVGANDVVRAVRPTRAVQHLERAVRDLRAGGVTVIVGTCPDLGTLTAVLPPLRQLVRGWSRRIAAGQILHVLRAGGRTVSLADVLGPEFTAEPAFFFGADRFHPSAAGYAALADVLLPSTMAALGLIGDEEAVRETYRGDPVVPIAAATLRALSAPGVELDHAQRPRHRLGRLWVTVTHRRKVGG